MASAGVAECARVPFRVGEDDPRVSLQAALAQLPVLLVPLGFDFGRFGRGSAAGPAAERPVRQAASAGVREACRSFVSPVSRSNVRRERISAWCSYELGSRSTTARRRHSTVADAGRVEPARFESKAKSRSQPPQNGGVLPFPLIIANRAFA